MFFYLSGLFKGKVAMATLKSTCEMTSLSTSPLISSDGFAEKGLESIATNYKKGALGVLEGMRS
jgi:hypothetical protein